ncbi:hypothetical protein VTK73DRAFT_1679 [Phialemonium thermophilum]|uniref:Glycoside hydrolase family 30 protein n=1 Tax=Phialemonium thermophilum TaxID=223376 RepID=A0ABR3VT55_9PEZI
MLCRSLPAVLATVGAIWPQSGAAQITVHTDSPLQRMDGFGFSQAFGRAKEFQNTPAALQKQALEYLFNTTTGAGFSIIRNRVGSGGAGDSILPRSPGSPSATPNYTWDGDDSGQVWFSKQAVGYGVKTIYADAWSAPGFMKTSGNEASAGYLCGTSTSVGRTIPRRPLFLSSYALSRSLTGSVICVLSRPHLFLGRLEADLCRHVRAVHQGLRARGYQHYPSGLSE